MTDQEFKEKWRHLHRMQQKFCLRYLENGCDAQEAAQFAGYNPRSVKSAHYTVMRKVNDIVDYLIQKNNIIQTIVKPTWVIHQYMKLYDNTESDITRVNILKDISKLLKMTDDNPQVNVNNNIPPVPVQIMFTKEEEKNE